MPLAGQPEAACSDRLVSSASTGRVHFPDSELTPEHAGEIIVQFDESKKHGEAHLGFLQEGRKYEVAVEVPILVGKKVRVVNHNSHVRVKEIRANNDTNAHEFVIEIDAIQDRLIDDQMLIVDKTNEQHSFTLILSAKVLGRGQGTPSLKKGVRCIGHEEGYSSEQEEPGRVLRKASTHSFKKSSPLHPHRDDSSPHHRHHSPEDA